MSCVSNFYFFCINNEKDQQKPASSFFFFLFTHQKKMKHQDQSKSEGITMNSISWPILLAVIPTLGAFIVGSAEDWGDFVLTVLVLYYVYKWITGMVCSQLIYDAFIFVIICSTVDLL